jgi:drug/metabolite transporter (DMT)-like permease
LSPRQWSLLVLLSLIWGGSFLFVAIGVKELPPVTIVLARVAIGAMILVPMVILLGHALPNNVKAWRAYAVMAVLNNAVPFTLIVWSQQHITAGLASVLNATAPLWSVLLFHLFAIEAMTLNRVIGILIGVVGVVVLVGPEALGGNGLVALGMFGMLVATLFYGLSGVWARRFKGTPPIVSAAAQLACATVMLLPAALLIEQPWTLPVPSTAAIVSMIGLGALSTAFAYVIFFHLMMTAGPSNAMLVTLIIPISAVVLGHLVLGEPIHLRHIAGGVVIGVALLVIDGRLFARQSAAHQTTDGSPRKSPS